MIGHNWNQFIPLYFVCGSIMKSESLLGNAGSINSSDVVYMTWFGCSPDIRSVLPLLIYKNSTKIVLIENQGSFYVSSFTNLPLYQIMKHIIVSLIIHCQLLIKCCLLGNDFKISHISWADPENFSWGVVRCLTVICVRGLRGIFWTIL